MANTILTTKIALVNKTTEEWGNEQTIPIKGCPCVEFTTDGKSRLKIGDGIKIFTELPYESLSENEIEELIQSSTYDDTTIIERISDVEGSVESLETFVGTIPEGYTATTITGYAKELVDAVAANGYDDTDIKSRITAAENSISILNGTGEGSVSKQVADAVASIVSEAPEAYDTLKEISDWITNHVSDAATMNSQINTNKENIATLTNLIGSLPEGSASNTIIEYIMEAISNNTVQSVVAGTSNGTIAVDGADVGVTGLDTMAFESKADYINVGDTLILNCTL